MNMVRKANKQLAKLSLQDQQLLELCGQEILHAARKSKVIHSNKNLKDQFKSK